MNRDQLISYFRGADKTSDLIGGRQAAVFKALRDLAGHQREEPNANKPKVATAVKTKASMKKPKTVESQQPKAADVNAGSHQSKPPKSEMALTVRIEINLPTEGTQETYDAIFKSIKSNLFP